MHMAQRQTYDALVAHRLAAYFHGYVPSNTLKQGGLLVTISEWTCTRPSTAAGLIRLIGGVQGTTEGQTTPGLLYVAKHVLSATPDGGLLI